MKSKATHTNFKNWELTTLKLDNAVTMTEKAVKLSGKLVQCAVWFPLSCVNVVDQFEVEVPTWLLSKKGLYWLA